GRVEAVGAGEDGVRLRIATRLGAELGLGDSISVNGVCLTATAVAEDRFDAEAMNQTLKMTTLGAAETGTAVNLELAMRASDRLGGHIVQGHVDGVCEVLAVVEDGFARRLRVALGPELARYAIAQGSIALDGVSLTVAALGEGWAEVSLIPETLERTSLGAMSAGDEMNVECDVVAKYVERLVAPLAARKETA
ncbi:MAG TPA: riboflavin synthase, partial [Solirubrobacterales bacterium]|nr:riboflavin synthase [Solirubrobacterales bacterium]